MTTWLHCAVEFRPKGVHESFCNWYTTTMLWWAQYTAEETKRKAEQKSIRRRRRLLAAKSGTEPYLAIIKCVASIFHGSRYSEDKMIILLYCYLCDQISSLNYPKFKLEIVRNRLVFKQKWQIFKKKNQLDSELSWSSFKQMWSNFK